MFDLMEQFILFLMNQFYQSLKEYQERWTQNLVNAVKGGNQKSVELCMKNIQNCREMMDDLSDENMDTKDFVGLIAEKYGFVRA